MALYRNIAGMQVGLTLPSSTTFKTGGTFTIPQVVQVLPADSWDTSGPTYEADMNSRYDYLLSTSIYDLTQLGYYIESNGSVFQWTDAAHTTSKVYLGIDWIQNIENSRGTAGTLLMHFNEPVLAKDTAGYGGGTRASQGASTVYSTPIDAVTAMPTPATGPNVINDYNPPIPTTPIVTPIPTGTVTPTSTSNPAPTPTTMPPATTGTGTVLPLATIAGLTLVLVAGDRVLKKRQKAAFVGGLGLLYFAMTKK